MDEYTFFSEITLTEDGSVNCSVDNTEIIGEYSPSSRFEFFSNIRIEDGKLVIKIKS